jgi:HK97 family phage major capsid protein
MTEDIKMVETALNGLQSKLDKALADHTSEIEKHGKASTELTGKVDALAQKHAEAEAKLDDLLQKAAGGFQKGAPKAESLGSIFLKSDAFSAFQNGSSDKVRVEIKNTIIGSAGSPADPSDVIVAPDRRLGIVPGAFRQLGILDVLPLGSTGSNQVYYTQEDAYTNAAAETSEGAGKPESDLSFKLIEEPVRTVAHFLKLSNQVLSDAPALEGYVNRRLTHGLRNRLEFQALRGNGASPNVAGLSASGRHTAFTPVTGETALDSLNRAKYAVTGADFMATHIFINPADWGAIERSKVSGGGYVLGDGGAITYVNNGLNPLVWGLTVIPSNNVASGKFYVLDINAVELMIRQGVTVEMGFVDKDFTNNLVTLRAEMRAAMAVYQPTAVRYGDLSL